jgi:hypothetical protein
MKNVRRAEHWLKWVVFLAIALTLSAIAGA